MAFRLMSLCVGFVINYAFLCFSRTTERFVLFGKQKFDDTDSAIQGAAQTAEHFKTLPAADYLL